MLTFRTARFLTTCFVVIASSSSGVAIGHMYCARDANVCINSTTKQFDKQSCTQQSPWIVEGEVRSVHRQTAMEYDQLTKQRVMRTTITGLVLQRTRDVKGSLDSGAESVWIPYGGCGTRMEYEWASSRAKIRVYGRKIGENHNPYQVVPYYNYIELLSTGN